MLDSREDVDVDSAKETRESGSYRVGRLSPNVRERHKNRIQQLLQ